MSRMRRLVSILLTVLFLGGCGGDYLDELMTQGEQLKDRMCACTDLACAQKVVDELHAWKKGIDAEKVKAAEEKATPEEREKLMKRMKALADGADACQEKWNDKGLVRRHEGF